MFSGKIINFAGNELIKSYNSEFWRLDVSVL